MSTYVYVSNANDGDIGGYSLVADGAPAFMERYATGKGSSWIEIVATE